MLYIDAFMGVSGDMFAGALLDLGADLKSLQEVVESLKLGVEINASKILKKGISATKFTVIDKETKISAQEPASLVKQEHRHLCDIIKIINNSIMEEDEKNDAIEIFKIIAEAEGKIHGIQANKVHFHEVGAVDSIVDVVVASYLFNKLNISKMVCSPINVGGGTVDCAHGVLPVPAPATTEILKETTVYSDGTLTELTTPTGAAIVKYYCKEFGEIPKMEIKKIGYGAGTKDLEKPNILRVILGKKII